MDLSKYLTTQMGVKDYRKFKPCTKLISIGCEGSSSHSYSKHPMANVGKYDSLDIVGISSNGQRPNRVKPFYSEIKKAINMGVQTFIIDNRDDRSRPYNIGEREVEVFLKENGISEHNSGNGIFTKDLI